MRCYPFRLRTSLCALSVCILSACGGGGDHAVAGGATPAALDDEALLKSDGNAALVPNSGEIVVLTPTKANITPGIHTAQLGESRVQTVGTTTTYTIGYSVLETAAMRLAVGHLQGNKDKFAIQIEVPGSTEVYQCISTAWTTAEKAVLGSAPTCGPTITFSSTNQLVMVRATVPGTTPGQKIVLNVNSTMDDPFEPAEDDAAGT
jgi:hypothetical protein